MADDAAAVEFIKDRLFFVCTPPDVGVPPDAGRRHHFGVGERFVYQSFFADFGPLNLGHVYRFVELLDGKLRDPALADRELWLVSSTHAHQRANTAFLLGAFMLVRQGLSPEEAYRPLLGIYPPLVPFRDASFGICSYGLSVFDCLCGVAKAMRCGYFSFDAFDISQYEYYEAIEHGDLSWILPGKLLAFSGPHDERRQITESTFALGVHDYVDIFRRLGVSCVVRFNKKCYDRRVFLNAGINHVDLYYVDGGTPSDDILHRFLEVCERERGAVAVHCKAGLGRTGTNIAAYAMKHDGFTAPEIIAWCRICRPGSIVGPQQHYLEEIRPRMARLGASGVAAAPAPAPAPAPQVLAAGAGGSGGVGIDGRTAAAKARAAARQEHRRRGSFDAPTAASRAGSRQASRASTARSRSRSRGRQRPSTVRR